MRGAHLIKTLFRNSEKILVTTPTINSSYLCRTYAALPRRFYKKTGVVHCNGEYEIILDNKKLKTPGGQVFKVDNEMLALGVATEWDSQKSTIDRANMHLTALCSTAQDNPNHLKKDDIINHIIGYMETDTILYYSNNDILEDLQKKQWEPLVRWFCERFQVNIIPTKDIMHPNITDETKQVIYKYLMSYNFNSIIGFNFAIESLKSVILTFACVERKLSVDQAVLLSRLEEEYQTQYWGRVEWAHDVNQYDLQARVAAAVLFIHLNSMSESVQSKINSEIKDYFDYVECLKNLQEKIKNLEDV